eukprot:6174655-Pleurochrysis_carterae.AAC.1
MTLVCASASMRARLRDGLKSQIPRVTVRSRRLRVLKSSVTRSQLGLLRAVSPERRTPSVERSGARRLRASCSG